jgi:ABC-2 type transport system permease protein
MKWFREVLTGQIRMRLAYPWGFWISLALDLTFVVAINWFLWAAVLSGRGGEGFPGYTHRTLVLYAMITAILRKVQMNTDQFGGIGDDIYNGALNKYLVYPVSYFAFRYAMHLGSSLVTFAQSLVALAGFWLLFAMHDQPLPTPGDFLQFMVLVFLGVSLRFITNAVLQCMAFWFEQVWALMVMFSFLIMLLGGQLLPMELYPLWAQQILALTPFPLFAAWPADALMGKLSWMKFLEATGVSIIWLGLVLALARFTFGVRNYSGIGA